MAGNSSTQLADLRFLRQSRRSSHSYSLLSLASVWEILLLQRFPLPRPAEGSGTFAGIHHDRPAAIKDLTGQGDCPHMVVLSRVGLLWPPGDLPPRSPARAADPPPGGVRPRLAPGQRQSPGIRSVLGAFNGFNGERSPKAARQPAPIPPKALQGLCPNRRTGQQDRIDIITQCRGHRHLNLLWAPVTGCQMLPHLLDQFAHPGRPVSSTLAPETYPLRRLRPEPILPAQP